MTIIRSHSRLLGAAGLILLPVIALGYWLLGDLPAPTAENLRPVRPSTFIYDRHGRLLYEVIQGEGKQTPLSFDQIPPHCWQATVAVEDSRFFHHPGFDPLAILRAAYLNLRSGRVVSGASTITQQLARNTLLAPEERYQRSLRRKLREAWLAWRIERRFNKREILALYLNQTYYGNFAYGLEAAAEAYFGKSARELDLAECSLLAGLVQNPAAYNPLQHPQAARWRQATVLNLMVWNGYISRQEAELALAETPQFAASPFTIKAPHFVSYVEAELERLLANQPTNQLTNQPTSHLTNQPPNLTGLRVYTTLDLDWQQQAEAIVRRRLQELQDDPDAPAGRRVDNAALVAMDPQTGAILAMVGSPDYFDPQINGAVNAALALRQPGSAIKPLTYAAAMDPERAQAAGRQPLTPATIIADVRTVFLTAEGDPYVPQNYDLQWHGPVSVRTALASSYNVPAVKVLDSIGVDALIDQARRQGITTFKPGERYGLALTLGGGEVSLLELTAAYAAFANGGYRVEPFAVQRIEDVDGNVLFEAPDSEWQMDEWANQRMANERNPQSPIRNPKSEISNRYRALDERVAYLITDILSDNEARAPAFGRNSVLRLSRPAAVKTGTTTDWRDNWTIGYTPDLVTGVWVGNADNTPMIGVSGVTGAGPIWHDFMEAVHRHRPVREFAQPDGLVRMEICVDSGLLSTELCARRRSELFIAGTEPTEFDNVYRRFPIDICASQERAAGRPSGTAANSPMAVLAGPGTPPECVEERVYRVYPPELQEWARENGIPQPPVAVAAPDTQRLARSGGRPELVFPGEVLTLTSPDPNSVYRLSRALPAEVQQIRLAARSDSPAGLRQVTFLVDGRPVGQAQQPPYEVWWPLQRGTHAISAVAETETGQFIRSPTNWITVK